MDLRERARDAAEGATEVTGRVADRADDLRERATERASRAVEATRDRVADDDLPAVEPRLPEPAPDDATEVVAGVETVLDDLDARYTASSAVEGAGLGSTVGPYGTALGAGVGAAYGAYSSVRSEFDPEDPSGPIGERVDAEQLLSGCRHARTGYRYGGVVGTRGRLAGAALGLGAEVLASDLAVGERVTDAVPVDSDRWPDVGGRFAGAFGDHLGTVGALAARHSDRVERLAAIASEVEFAAAREAATTSLSAARRVPEESTITGKAAAGRDALAGVYRLYRLVDGADP